MTTDTGSAIDIRPAVDALHEVTTTHVLAPERSDLVKGNIKARQRMVAQYAVAGRPH